MAIYILGPDQDGNCCTCAERVNVCDTCGETCVLNLPTPIDTDCYADLTAAQAALTQFVSNCVAYIQTFFTVTVNSFTATYGLNSISISSDLTFGNPGSVIYWMAVDLSTGILEIDFDVVGGLGAQYWLYTCEGVQVDFQRDTSSTTGTFMYTVTSAGSYLIAIQPIRAVDQTTVTVTLGISAPTLTLNPIVANYLVDGSCTGQVECS